MARFYGEVGYGDPLENPANSGIWVDAITEYAYFGDIIRNASKPELGDNLNFDLSLGNSVSIVADQYAIEHFHRIRYIRWAGTLWTVTNVEVKSPRLVLSLGSVYNGPTPTAP